MSGFLAGNFQSCYDVITAAVKCGFSSMKPTKNKIPEENGWRDTLEHTMHIDIEGPDKLRDKAQEAVIDFYKQSKYVVKVGIVDYSPIFLVSNFWSHWCN